ncbi:unnamed protein product [Closterium sp. NIES-54]
MAGRKVSALLRARPAGPFLPLPALLLLGAAAAAAEWYLDGRVPLTWIVAFLAMTMMWHHSVRGEQQQRRLHEERRAEEERREMWQQKLLRDLAVSAREPADWLNKLLVLLWPNVLHPRTLAATQAAMQGIMDRDVPPHVQSVEILEMDFGDAAPQVGPLGLFWSTRQPHKTHSTARHGGAAAAAAGLTADGQSSGGVAGGRGGGVVGGEGEGGTEGAREQREQHESERENEHTQGEEGEEEEQGLNVDVRWGSSGLSVVLAVHFASDASFPSSSSHSLLPASSSLSSSQHGTPHSLASSSSVAPAGFKIQLAVSNVAVAGTVSLSLCHFLVDS